MPPLENGFLHATNSSPKSHWVNADKSVIVKQYYALARGYQVPHKGLGKYGHIH